MISCRRHLCCVNWYSSGIIGSSLHIRKVVKFYNYKLRLRYGCIPIRYSPLSVPPQMKVVTKNDPHQHTVVPYKPLSLRLAVTPVNYHPSYALHNTGEQNLCCSADSVMYQSIPSVTILPTNFRAFYQNFCPGAGHLT